MKKYIILSVAVAALFAVAGDVAAQTRVISDQEIAVEMVKRTAAANQNMGQQEQKLLFEAFEKQISGMTPEQKIEIYAKAKASSEINSMRNSAEEDAKAAAAEAAVERKQAEENAMKAAENKMKSEEETRNRIQEALSNPDGKEKLPEGVSTVPKKDLKPLTDGKTPGSDVAVPTSPVAEEQPPQYVPPVQEQYIPRRQFDGDMPQRFSGSMKRKIEDRDNIRSEYEEYLKNQTEKK